MINLLPTITKENMRPPLESYISVVNITGKRVWVKNTHKNPKFGKVSKSQPGNSQLSSQIGTCLTLPNLGFLWVFFKYPKISKNGNPLLFPVNVLSGPS